MSKDHTDTSSRRLPASTKPRLAQATGVPAVLALLGSGNALGGPEIARQLGISRAAVWKQIEALRAAGLEIDSGSEGYRLTHPLDWLDITSILAEVPGATRRRLGEVENHWRLDSTSSECLRRATGLPDRSFVFADWQNAGRGRRGRHWVSPPATNLQFSCLKRFPSGYAALSGLSLAVGVAAVNALEGCGVRGIGLKWPNDLVHDDAKLGGILVELGGEFMGPCHAVVGIGLNLRLSKTARSALDRPCTDLASLCGEKLPSRNTLAAALIACLVEALDVFEGSGFAGFADAWAEYDALAGHKIRIDTPQGVLDAVADGVDARGALRVRAADGMHSFDSAEVTVRAA
jgi:BirA family transcriptional regulator, biotin operon repressor / biotin---[acetyl-CoA-carboxylase] ligase